MTKRHSRLLKMIQDIPDHRKLDKFPPPYKNSNLYKTDFSEHVLEFCASEVNGGENFKICKVIVLGDVSVGKTCIVNRFCRQMFNSAYKATIGIDFEVERFSILNVPFTVQIWDTAGQERFRAIAQSYYRNAHVIIVVFDLTNSLSLSHCKNWFKEALASSSESWNPLKFLVGTKKDLLSQSALNFVEVNAAKLAKEIKAEFWAVSSKTGENIEGLFFRIAALTFDDYILREAEMNSKPQVTADFVSFNKAKNKGNPSCYQFCTKN